MQIKFRITVDCLVFAYDNHTSKLKILLIKRKNEPAKGEWALPGGFVNETEEFLDTALKKLETETGATDIFLEELNAYSMTDPSPSNRLVSIAFYAIIKLDDFNPSHDNSHIYKWQTVDTAPRLPFDHTRKLNDGLQRIKERVFVKPIIFKLLPQKFTLNNLQALYEQVFHVELDNRNFRRKCMNLCYIKELDEYEQNVSRRPGKLYEFDESKFNETMEKVNFV